MSSVLSILTQVTIEGSYLGIGMGVFDVLDQVD